MTFLPNDYNVPESPSSYMKFKPGPNRFRILGPAALGYVYWNLENKPVRSRTMPKFTPPDIRLKKSGMPEDIKHFWAFPVYNYDAGLIQVLEITQSTIQRGMKTKIDNRGGNATNYDWIITKSGEGLDTEYDIDVAEATLLAPEIAAAYASKTVNLDALFDNGDPFNSPEQAQTPQTPPETQNGPRGIEKLRQVANSLPNSGMGVARQNTPVAPDIVEQAAKLQADYEAIDHESPPFS